MAGPGHSREPSAGRHAAAQDGRNFRLQASSSHPHLGEDVKPSLPLAARMPPPPPLRSSSNVAPNGHQASRPGPSNQTEVSYEERRAMWAERVKLLSEAVAARSEYVKLQEELESMQRLSRSVRFDEVLEEDKARMDARISSLTSQCDAKKTELNRMLVRLTDADFWPVGQKMPPTLEDGHAAMQTTINELKKSLASLYKLIEDTRADFAKSRETQATAFTDSEGNQTTEPRAAKRRRLSSGDDTLVEDEDRKRAMVTAAEVDELRGKLLEVERQLADVQNEMVQHDNELLQEIEDLVHSRLEDIPGSASTSRGGRAPDNDPKKQRDNVLDHIRRDLDSTGNDILSLAQEVAGLIKQMNAKDQEQTNLRLENEQLKQRVEALEQQHILDMEAFHANRLEMQALNTAVSTFLSQPHPSPPTLPPQPLFEEIAKDIHPVLKHLLSEDLKPLLQESHQKVSNMLQESTVNAWRDILSRLKPTIKSAEVVAALINQVHGNGEEDMAEQSVFSKMSH
ncbi:hypothetical protein IEO21_01571 [Rhodonia placenta]|uniref:Uncharacterized protein n=1 Tax=Rhodonia placenta TaxID=104341 RepID=A0A8H7P9K0_9APHY|nr:hypothetical protein IEO21_01571 [Postia placenta]